MEHKSNSIFSAAASILAESYAGDYVNTGVLYNGNGVRVGQTYQMKSKAPSRFTTNYDVKVLKIDRNIVIYKKVAAPGTMSFQPERMPIEDFEDSLITMR
jgi:hypothetical protein